MVYIWKPLIGPAPTEHGAAQTQGLAAYNSIKSGPPSRPLKPPLSPSYSSLVLWPLPARARRLIFQPLALSEGQPFSRAGQLVLPIPHHLQQWRSLWMVSNFASESRMFWSLVQLVLSSRWGCDSWCLPTIVTTWRGSSQISLSSTLNLSDCFLDARANSRTRWL